MATLVTGGAGYIGSVMVEQLREAGEEVVVLDNLSRGHHGALEEGVPFYEGQIGDRELVARICREHRVEECVHFAARDDLCVFEAYRTKGFHVACIRAVRW